MLANSPFAYKTFHDSFSNSPYAKSALKLQGVPKAVPLMQFTHLAKHSPNFRPGHFGHGGNFHSRIVTLPAKGINGNNLGMNNGRMGKVSGFPGRSNSMAHVGKHGGNFGLRLEAD